MELSSVLISANGTTAKTMWSPSVWKATSPLRRPKRWLRSRPGAELLVARGGNHGLPYTYDVLAVTIVKGDIEGKKIADNKVQFGSNVGSTVTGISFVSETFLFDENHSVRLFEHAGNFDRARAAIKHAKLDDFGAAKLIASVIADTNFKTSLTLALDKVVAAKADEEARV